MAHPTRLSEFAVGVGKSVYVDSGPKTPLVHLRYDCPDRGREIGSYSTERIARAAIPKVKPCRTCR